MNFKIKTTGQKINKICKSDILDLDFSGNSGKVTTMAVKVIEIKTDRPRCSGCNCFLEGIKTFEYSRKQYCEGCYKRRLKEARKRGAKQAKTYRLKYGNKPKFVIIE